MTSAYSVQQIRRLEEVAMADGGDDVLMQRAAHGLALLAAAELRSRRARVYGSRVLIMVGPGNNGGDALYAGQRLARRGADVLAVRCLGAAHPGGLAALLQAGGRVLNLADLVTSGRLDQSWDLALDGILGIGGRPGLPDDVQRLVGGLAEGHVPVVAVDLPSGVSADTGAVPGAAIRASRTVTFGKLKPCHLLEPARSHCGRIDLVDIGLDASDARADLEAIDLNELARWWPRPEASSDKYSRGVLGIDTGSEQYPGAAVMSTLGAAHAGAGMIRFLGAHSAAELIKAKLPNVVFGQGRVQALLFGSGWGDRDDGRDVLAEAAERGLPAVVDADGLRYLPERAPSTWLLTPHAGELARLLGEDRRWVTDDPVRAVRAGVDRTGATVLLKGATQLVAGPDSAAVRVALPGPAWTAQAGSGDVLAGVCGTLLAAGVPADRAGQMGASIQALAASRHLGPLPPQELAEQLPATIGSLAQGMGGWGSTGWQEA
ncbi:MAG TPA: NAD(P)H-hydrate epimerase [Propionibacteriaceae bacterium]|nr:NAD(P)H-hydrate epimerase [Propionibacteriaceae bacterium]